GGHEPLHAARQRKVKLRAALRRELPRLTSEFASNVDEARADPHRIVDRAAAVRGGNEHPVSNRPAPIAAGLEPIKAKHRAHETTDVAGVAVGVPARGADDGLR